MTITQMNSKYSAFRDRAIQYHVCQAFALYTFTYTPPASEYQILLPNAYLYNWAPKRDIYISTPNTEFIECSN